MVLPIKKIWVNEMGLGVNTSKRNDNLFIAAKSEICSGSHPWLHNVILWGRFSTATHTWTLPAEIWILLVWGEVLASVGSKSSPGESNRKPNLVKHCAGNELSVGIISENPTGKNEAILIDYIID